MMKMKFKRGARYRFRPKPGKYTQKPCVAEYHTRTLVYLKDAPGDRMVHHIFQWRGGALECFSDVQLEDYTVIPL
ncbi:MAG: hypothetical protein K5841_10420 [Fretibacterium sp.]|nr:hypothetical protein [Fretibacterium sp.]